MSKTHKGRYRPVNPDKYRGNPMAIEYRSSWEREFFKWVDANDRVEWWSSEEKAIWYYDPVAKKKRRYFPDIIMHFERSDGIMVTEVVEIKPHNQTVAPDPNPKRRTQAWMNRWMTYVTNQAKWKAATAWAEDRGYNFRLLTENDASFISKGNKSPHPKLGPVRPVRNRKKRT